MDMAQHSAFARVCRACLQACPEGAVMTSLFYSDFQLTSNATSLLALADITIDYKDPLPQQICQTCLNCLNEALAFKLKCERSHRYLQHVFTTQSFIAPEDLYTNFQHSMFAVMTQLTSDSSERVNAKIEPDNFEEQSEAVEVKIEYANDEDDSEGTSTDDNFYSSTVNKNETPDIQEKVNTTRLHVTPTESIAGKHAKNYLSAAEIRLRDLIFKTDGNKSNKEGSHRAIRQEKVASVKTTQSVTIESLRTFNPVQYWSSCAAEKRAVPLRGDKIKKLKECLERFEALHPKCASTTVVNVPKMDEASKDDLDCKICGKIYSSNRVMRTHMIRHAPSVTCEYCGRKFGAKAELKYHCMSRHGLERNYHCDHCSYQGNTRNMLIEHIRIHTGERPYICETCGISFRSKNILRQHRLRHFGRQYKCDVCSKWFYQQGHLNAHMRTTHLKLPQRRFYCTQPGCDVNYAKIHNMRNHLSGTHNIPRDQQGRLRKNPLTV